MICFSVLYHEIFYILYNTVNLTYNILTSSSSWTLFFFLLFLLLTTIVKAAGGWSKGKTIPTHTVWMGLGHDPSDNKDLSTQLMIGIANATGGVYRALENGH